MYCSNCEANFKDGMAKIKEGIRLIKEDVGDSELATLKEATDLDEAITELQALYRRLS